MRALQSRALRLVGLVLVALALVFAAGYLLLPVAVRMVISALDLAMSGGVWLIASAASGASTRTILLMIGRAAFLSLTSARALAILSGLVLVGAAALYVLQRLLGLEEEGKSSR